MKEKLKKIGQAFWSKTFLVLVIITLAGALGYKTNPAFEQLMEAAVCALPGVSGCGND